MICQCPKCKTDIELDHADLTEEWTSTACHECKTRFWIHKESSVRRALKKDGAIFCIRCGNTLSHLVVCPSCGLMYPDYFVARTNKVVTKGVRRKAGFTGISYSTEESGYSLPQKSGIKLPPFVTTAILGVAFVALAIGGGVTYKKRSAEHQYARTFAFCLYGIKAGRDLGIKQGGKISSEWKAKMDAGQFYSPRLADKDLADANSLKEENENTLKKLTNPPAKYAKAHEKFAKLIETYNNIYSVTTTPTGSMAGFADSVAKADNDFTAATQELKASLPEDLREEIKKTSMKFKGLQFILS